MVAALPSERLLSLLWTPEAAGEVGAEEGKEQFLFRPVVWTLESLLSYLFREVGLFPPRGGSGALSVRSFGSLPPITLAVRVGGAQACVLICEPRSCHCPRCMVGHERQPRPSEGPLGHLHTIGRDVVGVHFVPSERGLC